MQLFRPVRSLPLSATRNPLPLVFREWEWVVSLGDIRSIPGGVEDTHRQASLDRAWIDQSSLLELPLDRAFGPQAAKSYGKERVPAKRSV